MKVGQALEAAGEQQHDDDDQNDPETAAGEVAPTGAVRPCRQRAYQEQYEDDEEDCADAHEFGFLRGLRP